MDLHVSLCGLLVGILIGLTGMGGGSIMTPMMIFLFHMHPAVAVGTDLMYSSITKVFGSWQHIRQKSVDFKAFKYLSFGSVPGAMVGSVVIGVLQYYLPMGHVNTIIGQILGFVYLLVIGSMLWRFFRRKKNSGEPKASIPVPRTKLIVLGSVAGFVVGLSSVGSGSLYIAVLAIIYPIASAKLVGTDILQAVLVTGTAGLVHLALGNVNLLMVLSLLLGSIPGILIGSRLTVRVPEVALRACLLLMLGWSSWSLLVK